MLFIVSVLQAPTAAWRRTLSATSAAKRGPALPTTNWSQNGMRCGTGTGHSIMISDNGIISKNDNDILTFFTVSTGYSEK